MTARALRLYKPTTPARRHASVADFSHITSKASLKKQLRAAKKTGGRNHHGRITVRHQGGGAKRFLRAVDFKQDKFDIVGKVTGIEYDPNRSVDLAVVTYTDGDKRYLLLPENVTVGSVMLSSRQGIKPEPGNRMPLEHMPLGVIVHNIELKPGKGGAIVRSAGTAAQVMAVEGAYAQLRLPSGEVRLVPKECAATIGQLSGQQHIHIRYGKAGRMRHRGIRPSVRGKAMNPVDHPHGGGEGHNPIGMKAPKTPWGKPALGVLTRRPKKYSDALIVARRKSRKKR